MSDVGNPEVAGALDELQQYLSDKVAPLMVVDSMEILIKSPPNLTASAIHSWATLQTRLDHSATFSDYLYHAVAKIHMIQEYKLIPAEVFHPFLIRLKQSILAYCPSDDRPLLKANLDSLGTSGQSATQSQVEVIFRPSTSAPEPRNAGPEAVLKKSDIQRFSQLIKRLEKRLNTAGMPAQSAAPQSREQLVSEALVEAARSASETVEINKLLDHLRTLGIQANPDDVFGALGKNLPGWYLNDSASMELPEDSNLQAMRKMISKAHDTREAGDRFHYLVKSGVDRFNEGALAQAASIFGLAKKIMEAKEVDSGAAEIVRARTHENLDPEHLRKSAETPEQHSVLRKILNFFPAFSPNALLESLRPETKRERRRLLLSLLEVHGEWTRAAVIELLRVPLGQHYVEEEIYFRRNLIYLLRRIPVTEGENSAMVLEAVLQHTDFSLPGLLVKEALAYLAQSKEEGASLALIDLLHQAEETLSDGSKKEYDRKELLNILDRIVSALCRSGTHASRTAVIEHAFKKKAQLGNTLARLSEFSKQDLSDDQVNVGRLLGMLKQNLPLKRFGIAFPQRDQAAVALVEALSATPLHSVRNELEALASQYPEMEAGIAASKVLAKYEAPSPGLKRAMPESSGGASLSGDLDLFGLPNLLQNLSDSAVTGTLKLRKPDGEQFASLRLEKGELSFCRYGNLSSEEAFFQLFERPQPGTFEFNRTIETSSEHSGSMGAPLPLVLEALRRYDEVQQLRSVIPDNARLVVKGVQPSPLPAEKDGLLFRDLWTLIHKGSTPLQCEGSLNTDSYRIRRLIAHWVETGALELSS
jgi:hypothetical protein